MKQIDDKDYIHKCRFSITTVVPAEYLIQNWSKFFFKKLNEGGLQNWQIY